MQTSSPRTGGLATCLGTCLALGIFSVANASAASPGSVSPRATAFPEVPYTPGTIKPNHISAAELDTQLLNFYQQWKNLYLWQGCGTGRYLVKVDADGKIPLGGSAKDTITVSEAHGYGMLITVMMADVDPDAQKIFDGMVAYFKDNPAGSDPGLMAWNQVKGCKNGPDGAASATDGDLDIAYALLLADRKWGNTGQDNYAALAQTVLRAIWDKEVEHQSHHLMVGDWAGTDTSDARIREVTRSSDLMQSHLNAFSESKGDTRWLTVRDRNYDIIYTMTQLYSPSIGLMPDFIATLAVAPTPAKEGVVEGDHDGDYSWNAARYPWRIGLDYLLYAEPRALQALTKFNAWAQKTTGGKPQAFANTYELNGQAVTDEGAGDLAFVSALGVSAMIAPENQAWLNAVWTNVVAQDMRDYDYYGNTLKLLGMITMAGHWAKP